MIFFKKKKKNFGSKRILFVGWWDEISEIDIYISSCNIGNIWIEKSQGYSNWSCTKPNLLGDLLSLWNQHSVVFTIQNSFTLSRCSNSYPLSKIGKLKKEKEIFLEILFFLFCFFVKRYFWIFMQSNYYIIIFKRYPNLLFIAKLPSQVSTREVDHSCLNAFNGGSFFFSFIIWSCQTAYIRSELYQWKTINKCNLENLVLLRQSLY